jgi:hypothetical protein
MMTADLAAERSGAIRQRVRDLAAHIDTTAMSPLERRRLTEQKEAMRLAVRDAEAAFSRWHIAARRLADPSCERLADIEALLRDLQRKVTSIEVQLAAPGQFPKPQDHHRLRLELGSLKEWEMLVECGWGAVGWTTGSWEAPPVLSELMAAHGLTRRDLEVPLQEVRRRVKEFTTRMRDAERDFEAALRSIE